NFPDSLPIFPEEAWVQRFGWGGIEFSAEKEYVPIFWELYKTKRGVYGYSSPKGVFMWKMIMTYLYLRKRDPNDPKNLDIRFMHGMNRISIFMFLVALILMIVRWATS